MSNREEEEFYKQKYLKYKAKYLEAKNKLEGGKSNCNNNNNRVTCAIASGCTWDDTLKVGQKCTPSCFKYHNDEIKCKSLEKYGCIYSNPSCYFQNPGGRA
jgi:hypothetical protein